MGARSYFEDLLRAAPKVCSHTLDSIAAMCIGCRDRSPANSSTKRSGATSHRASPRLCIATSEEARMEPCAKMCMRVRTRVFTRMSLYGVAPAKRSPKVPRQSNEVCREACRVRAPAAGRRCWNEPCKELKPISEIFPEHLLCRQLVPPSAVNVYNACAMLSTPVRSPPGRQKAPAPSGPASPAQSTELASPRQTPHGRPANTHAFTQGQHAQHHNGST